MTYIYSAGPQDAHYKKSAFKLINLISKQGSKICGSSVIWYLRTLYPGKYYKYFQTRVETNGEEYIFLRGLDILCKTKKDEIDLKVFLSEHGCFKNNNEYSFDNLTFNLFFYCSSNQIIIPFASRNLWLQTQTQTRTHLKFGIVQSSRIQVKSMFHITNIIYNCKLMFNYWDDPNSLPSHTKSGDPIRLKESLDDNPHFYTHLNCVVSGRDVALIDSLIPNINTDVECEEGDICPICLDELTSRPVFTTICNHNFHIGCISQYLYNYYIRIFVNSKNEKAYTIDKSSIYCKCPMCKSSCFEISTIFDNKLDSLDMLKSIFLIN